MRTAVLSRINANAASGSTGIPAALAKSLAVPSGTSPRLGSASAVPSRCASAVATALNVPSPPPAMTVSKPSVIASST